MYRVALALLLSGGLIFAPVLEPVELAMAASKKKPVKRSDFTAAQREKITEYARALCKKKFGASARIYRIDYGKQKVWCRPPGS